MIFCGVHSGGGNLRGKNFRQCLWAVFFLLAAALPLRAGEYDAQIAKERAVIAQDPTNLDATYQLGNYLAWAGQYEEAIQVFSSLLAKDPHYEEAKIGIARVYAWEGKQEEAIRKYNDILKESPKNFEAYAGLGSLALWTNDFEKSIEYFKKALAINPEDIISLKGIGRAYLGRGDRRQAENYFTQAEILEIKKTPLGFIAALACGAGLVLFLLSVWIRAKVRRRKKNILKLELAILRYALSLYHQKTDKFPLALENLLEEKWRSPLSLEEEFYLKEGRRGDRGFLVDVFGNRYWYNPESGHVYSTTKGCEQW